jgi:rhodanese-related sulfurtransferase
MLNFLRPRATTATLSPADAVARHAKGEITVIDVRELAEFRATGQARGSLHIPMALIPLKADPKGPGFDPRLDPARPVAAYCASGARSGMAVQILRQLGYDAHNIGSVQDWARAGGAVSR